MKNSYNQDCVVKDIVQSLLCVWFVKLILYKVCYIYMYRIKLLFCQIHFLQGLLYTDQVSLPFCYKHFDKIWSVKLLCCFFLLFCWVDFVQSLLCVGLDLLHCVVKCILCSLLYISWPTVLSSTFCGKMSICFTVLLNCM